MELAQGSQVTMIGNRVNGVLQDDVFIDSDGITTIRAVSGKTLVTENNEIHFHGKQIEVVPFLDTCHKNLSKFVVDLADELGNA